MPASASTCSAPKIGVPVRNADGDRVRGPGAYLDTAVEHELGVEDTVAQLGDPHLPQAATEGTDQVTDQVVRERPGRHYPCWAKAMAVVSTAPIQIGSSALALLRSIDQASEGILDPDTDDVELLFTFANVHRDSADQCPPPEASADLTSTA